MKKIKLLYVLIMIGFVFAGIAGMNNFKTVSANNDPAFFQDTLSQEESDKFIGEKVTGPVKECLGPDFFATKCYNDVHFNPNRNRWDIGEVKIYKDIDITGSIQVEQCGTVSHLCEVKFNYKEQSVMARSSIFEEWKPMEQYMKGVCGKMKKL